MSDIPEDQIQDWLKKLERESWQLELLVSAFTIFLLIGAHAEFGEFLTRLQFQYNIAGPVSIAFIFLVLIQKSILVLTICLVVHLMLRGFWIGAIGLRSVQSSIDFTRLNYTEFFTEKLKKKVISLDRLVIKLDEICSVIFAFSFLIISILIAFGMFLSFLGLSGFIMSTLINTLPDGGLRNFFSYVAALLFLVLIIAGVIYMIDYFTLGFFKKIKWISKIYYPFYRFYNVITLSGLSRSIYYYLISKFSKKRIRIVYSVVGFVFLLMGLFSFDQYQYFPGDLESKVVHANFYDDQRPENEFIKTISLDSRYVDKPHFQIFIRYDPADNQLIRKQCLEFEPLKDDGLNLKLRIIANGANFLISGVDYSNEDTDQLLACQSAIYQISVNDSVYTSLKYHFFIHPAKDQRGLLTTIPTDAFNRGENVLSVRKIATDSTGNYADFVEVPFWYGAD